ncbi:hypothetical protein [Streptomyces sp. RFCAC02]|uniref:hypothetical protein n=1 Tax=Streptomyces sp. RFCAC02 TaxID=2499143 RepID=UPI0010201931|nr:hypothetical protein [Streptomyces sp. RFCAC02]
MTALSTNRRRRAIRSTLAVGAVSLGLAALTGCDAPTPSAHFTLNAGTESAEADHDCWAGGGDTLGAERGQECAASEDVPSFTAKPGETFRIGVDPEIAEGGGWIVLVNDLPLNEPYTSTYQTVPVDTITQAAAQADSQVAQQGGQPTGGPARVTLVKVVDGFDMAQIATIQDLYEQAEGVWGARISTDDED